MIFPLLPSPPLFPALHSPPLHTHTHTLVSCLQMRSYSEPQDVGQIIDAQIPLAILSSPWQKTPHCLGNPWRLSVKSWDSELQVWNHLYKLVPPPVFWYLAPVFPPACSFLPIDPFPLCLRVPPPPHPTPHVHCSTSIQLLWGSSQLSSPSGFLFYLLLTSLRVDSHSYPHPKKDPKI